MPASSKLLFAAMCAAILPARAAATPSTTFWAPSTSAIQSFGVLHLTYDTYFATDAAYPIDLGLTMGVLPWQELQLEIGFDLLYPTLSGAEGLDVPIYFNGKLGTPEDVFFKHQPGWSFGIYNVGIEEDVTDYNVIYGTLGKTFPYVGTLSAGGYYGLNKNLFVSSSGEEARAGFLGGWFSPAIDAPVIDRLHFAADVQTGENVLGAAGGGIYIYFTPAIGLLTGPVYFFDADLQPGQNEWMWSGQIDVDIDFRSSASSSNGGAASE